MLLASERGMSTVVTSTCRVMGSRELRKGRVGTAMAWGLKSQDSHFTTFLADQLLKHYCESGSFSTGDLLDNLGSCMVVSERLTFLAKYREFHKLRNHGDFKVRLFIVSSSTFSKQCMSMLLKVQCSTLRLRVTYLMYFPII